MTWPIPVNNYLLTGTTPVNDCLLTGTVQVNNSLLTGKFLVNYHSLTCTILVNIPMEGVCAGRYFPSDLSLSDLEFDSANTCLCFWYHPLQQFQKCLNFKFFLIAVGEGGNQIIKFGSSVSPNHHLIFMLHLFS